MANKDLDRYVSSDDAFGLYDHIPLGNLEGIGRIEQVSPLRNTLVVFPEASLVPLIPDGSQVLTITQRPLGRV